MGLIAESVGIQWGFSGDSARPQGGVCAAWVRAHALMLDRFRLIAGSLPTNCRLAPNFQRLAPNFR